MTYDYWRKDWEHWPPSYEERRDYINKQVRKNREGDKMTEDATCWVCNNLLGDTKQLYNCWHEDQVCKVHADCWDKYTSA